MSATPSRDFLSLLASLAPRLTNALKMRPRDLRNLPPQQRDGLRTSLAAMRAEIDATLVELHPGRPMPKAVRCFDSDRFPQAIARDLPHGSEF